ncbi:MAG: transposase [Actinomycetota bacterium]|nr:transposase [Actinomycetota bacterium]
MGRRSIYTAKQKAEVVLSVLSKQTTIAEACRRHGITETTFARWREQAVTAMEKGLEDRGGGGSGREAELEREIAILERKLGQLAVIVDLRGKAFATVDVRQRVELGKKWVAAAVAPVSRIAEALLVSRQSLYKVQRIRQAVRRPRPRPVMRELDLDVQVGPEQLAPEEALVVLARRHVAYGYRRLWAKLRRAGYVVNRKRVQRLLRLWGYGLTRPRPHPKAQGRPFEVSAPNQLWQTDMTAIWCGEDGWGYLTAVLDCFDRSMLGWSMTPRCRARDFSPAMEMALVSLVDRLALWPGDPAHRGAAPRQRHAVHLGALSRGRPPTRHQAFPNPLSTSRRQRARRADLSVTQTRGGVAPGLCIVRGGADGGDALDPRLQHRAPAPVA